MRLIQSGYNLPMYIIDEINATIDNPKKRDAYTNNLAVLIGSEYAGLFKEGHREFNHDPLSASMIGSRIAMKYGFSAYVGQLAAHIHTMADMASDMLVDNAGTAMRDLYEAKFNLMYEQFYGRNKRRWLNVPYQQQTNYYNNQTKNFKHRRFY